MIFFNFIISTLITNVSSEKSPIERLRFNLHKKHDLIINKFDELKNKIPKYEITSEPNVKELHNRIATFIERENNEQIMAILLANIYGYEFSSQLIDGKKRELNRVKTEFNMFISTHLECILIKDFIDIVKEYGLEDYFSPFLNRYYVTECGLTDPRVENGEQILVDMGTIVTMQIERIEFLEREIAALLKEEVNDDFLGKSGNENAVTV